MTSQNIRNNNHNVNFSNLISDKQSGFTPRDILMPFEQNDARNVDSDDDDASSNDVLSTTLPSVFLFDSGLDGRAEIANYNKFMDEIFSRFPSNFAKCPNLCVLNTKKMFAKQNRSIDQGVRLRYLTVIYSTKLYGSES